MFTLTINEEKFTYAQPVLISDAIHEIGLPFSMPCGGGHTCGKCKVTARGVLSEMTDEERRHLSTDEIAAGIRLACFTYALGDAEILTAEKKQEQILTAGAMEYFRLEPLADGYGIAVDIGTTTVVSYLYRPGNREPAQVVSHHNEQARYGADVISRIGYCNENGVAAPQETIVSQLNKSFSALCNAENISIASVDSAVITGNTTMLHLLFGLEPRGIAVAPFTPKSLFGEFVLPSQLGLCLPDTCRLYVPRSVSSYVGADITCAILASGMTEKKENSFLVDIGTNGEMALFSGGQLKCCSTAAGPAFEGAGIKMGMSALEGAVNKVWEEDGTLKYTTIGEKPAVGICGSGIIDAVAACVRCGLIDETGLIQEDNACYAGCIDDGDEPAIRIGNSGVLLTQADIRKIQLAKSAIRAGIDTLLHECGISAEALDTFYIAGGFGSFIDKQSAADIGLIPPSAVSHVKVIGNGAGMGAAVCLLSKEKLTESEQIAAAAAEVELSGNPYFMDCYIDRMMFETE